MGSSMSTAHSMEHVPDDALGEVLVRVPPHPATLARASLACKGLHRFIGGAQFRRDFQAHHHKSTPPPLLGFFHDDQSLPNNFLPIGDDDGDSPDRVSAAAFDPKDLGWRVVDSRHGRVLLQSPDRVRFLVWDPAAGRRLYINAPPAMLQLQLAAANHHFMLRYNNAAVVCAAAPGPGHLDHSDCHDCPFSVVLVATPDPGTTVAYLYSSELGLWNEVATADLSISSWLRISDRPVALVRNVLYWTLVHQSSCVQSSILAFDLHTHRLYLIEQPVYIFDAEEENVQVMETAEDGLLGLVAACGLSLQLWVLREYNGRGTERWSMPRQIDMYDLALAPIGSTHHFDLVWILSVEGSRVVFVRTEAGIFEVDLWNDLLKRRICDAYDIQAFYPYKSFYYRGT
ncbi:uncharacterized protein LOC8062808 [Sorghum bicolor]|nr:uncharacterized protein LOC8062808 [Sorghum bicolor]|eukprot:XP_002467358.2 uncharacterized protein LOC8062808 [Sorghum bicolor]